MRSSGIVDILPQMWDARPTSTLYSTPMKTLILFRHGKSAYPGGLSDHERPLASRGRRDAPAMAHWIAERGLVPDKVLCSDAVRTRQTLSLVLDEWVDRAVRGTPETGYRPGLYLASAVRILSLVAAEGGASESVMVVGHNPGMHDLAQALAEPAPTKPHRRLANKFPTAAVAVLTFDISRWEELATRRGELTAFMRPRDLSR